MADWLIYAIPAVLLVTPITMTVLAVQAVLGLRRERKVVVPSLASGNITVDSDPIGLA